MLAVTALPPFEMLTFCPLCAIPVDISYFILVSVDGVQSAAYAVHPFNDHIHILTVCDIAAGAGPATVSPLPCPPIVTHADGTLVSAANPATSKELIAYAVRLGQTNLPMTDRQAATQAAPDDSRASRWSSTIGRMLSPRNQPPVPRRRYSLALPQAFQDSIRSISSIRRIPLLLARARTFGTRT
jgi:hypothetical protein